MVSAWGGWCRIHTSASDSAAIGFIDCPANARIFCTENTRREILSHAHFYRYSSGADSYTHILLFAIATAGNKNDAE